MLPLTAFQRLFISGTVEYTHMQNKNSINKTFFIVVWSLSHVQFFNFSVLHGAQPARLLCPVDFPGKNTEWVAMPFSRGSYQLKDQNYISCIGRQTLQLSHQCTLPNYPPKSCIYFHFHVLCISL